MLLPEEIETERQVRIESSRHYRQELHEWAAIIVLVLALVILVISCDQEKKKGGLVPPSTGKKERSTKRLPVSTRHDK
jgi:hypothetical protein